MPVTVPLLDVIAKGCPQEWWPEDFRAIAKTLEANPNDRTPWGIIADWCSEHGEPDLARGFRYVAKRPDVLAEKHEYSGGHWWRLNGLPHTVEYAKVVDDADTNTIVGVAAGLAIKLKALLAELE